MKRFILLWVVLISCYGAYCQESNETLEYWFKSKDGLVYANNEPGIYLAIEFPGDSLQSTGIPNGYLINGQIYQVLANKYDAQKYNNSSDSAKEKELLREYEAQELEYLRSELFREKIESNQEWFKNSYGKRFNLWYYELPEIESDTVSLETQMKWQVFLSFVCNSHVIGINVPIEATKEVETFKKEIMALADNIDIYGYRIDLNALYMRLELEKEGSKMFYGDSLKGFEVEIPDWLNLTENSSSNFWVSTMPDIENVKNAIKIEWHEKDEFNSFKAFNKSQIEKKKIGDKIGPASLLLKKELVAPPNCNGICYKLDMVYGSLIYHTQYLTFEGKTHYFIVAFTATKETYEINLPKFQEFINNFELIN